MIAIKISGLQLANPAHASLPEKIRAALEGTSYAEEVTIIDERSVATGPDGKPALLLWVYVEQKHLPANGRTTFSESVDLTRRLHFLGPVVELVMNHFMPAESEPK